ncbi:MAG: hypothetical protein WBW71_11795, partial [Bacteroidota bacterium]
RGIFSVDQHNESAFLHELIELLATTKFDVLIPVGYPVTHYVAKHAADIYRYVKFLSPDPASEAIANDKYEIQRLAEKVSVPSPRTFLAQSQDDINDNSLKLGFPIIIKGRNESGQGIVATAHNIDELRSHFQKLITKFSLTQETYPILQEFVPGWGCGFFAMYDEGKCKREFMHRRIREYPPTGGVSCCAKSFYDARLSEYGKKLLDALHWHGVAMVEFRFDRRINDYRLIEINAKFWGSLDLALAAGADFPGDYVKIASGQAVEFSNRYKNITYQWLLSGDLMYGLRRPLKMPSIIFTAVNPFVRKDFLRLDDPFVLFMKIIKLLREIVYSIFRRK